MQEMIYAMHRIIPNTFSSTNGSLCSKFEYDDPCQHRRIKRSFAYSTWLLSSTFFNEWYSTHDPPSAIRSITCTAHIRLDPMYLTHLIWQYWNSNSFKLFNGTTMDSWMNELFTKHAFLSSSPHNHKTSPKRYIGQHDTFPDTYTTTSIDPWQSCARRTRGYRSTLLFLGSKPVTHRIGSLPLDELGALVHIYAIVIPELMFWNMVILEE